MILEPKKIKSVTASTFSPSICHEVMAPDAMILGFLILSDKEIGLNGKVIQRVWLVGSRGERSCRGVELLAIARRPGPAFLSHPVYAV